jgi:hypothetical protein
MMAMAPPILNRMVDLNEAGYPPTERHQERKQGRLNSWVRLSVRNTVLMGGHFLCDLLIFRNASGTTKVILCLGWTILEKSHEAFECG